jgi:hypothetical protein
VTVAYVATYASSTGTANTAGSPPANGSATYRSATNSATTSFTPAVGDTLVVKIATGQPITTVTSITNGYTGSSAKGNVDSWTLAAYETKATGVAPIWIYIATVTVTGAFNLAIGVTTTSSSSQTGNFWVERYTGVVPPSSGVWNAVTVPGPDTTSPFTSTITPQLPGGVPSVITWCAGDWNGATTTSNWTPTSYSSGAVNTSHSAASATGGLTMIGAYQAASATTAQTFGYTKATPSGQSISFAAVELPGGADATINTGQFLPFF